MMCFVDCGRYLSTNIRCSGCLTGCSHDPLGIGILLLGEIVVDFKSLFSDFSFIARNFLLAGVVAVCICCFPLVVDFGAELSVGYISTQVIHLHQSA